MCEWGTTVRVGIASHVMVADIDACISSLVRALNDGRVATVASCCGHGKGYGNIVLQDGRELLILPDYESARRVEKILTLAAARGEDR